VVLTYHDASSTHWPGRALVQAQLRSGTFPFVHTGASCGQPLAGNPNFGVFSPDTLLLFFLPLPVAFGIRCALPFLLGFVGARRWARAEGVPAPAAEVAAFGFVLGGVFLSAWRFYNSGFALAVAPWVLAASAKLLARAGTGDPGAVRRTAPELGLWAALEVLAGEPVIALITGLVVAGQTASALVARVLVRRAVGGLALASALAALLAAPQLAATAQIFPDSMRARVPFSYYTTMSNSARGPLLLQQVVPFPWGLPDRRGPGGFRGHEYYDGQHFPYLWTLHVGLLALGLLLLFSRPLARAEAPFWALAVAGVVLAFGRHVPGAKSLFFPGFKAWRVLSLDGRLRYPIKWWYVVALAVIPLLAHAAWRWAQGERASRPRLALAALAWGLSALVLVKAWPPAAIAWAGPLASLLALAGLFGSAARPGPRPLPVLAATVAVTLSLCGLPLVRALLDRPPDPPRPVGAGRVYVTTTVDPHPVRPPSAEDTSVPAYFRRATRELWPIAGSAAGIGYAFDEDPDGAYAAHDQVLREILAHVGWPDRAAELRLAGVAHVVADAPLPEPFREVEVLNAENDVRLYALDGAAPELRWASRVFHRPSEEAVALLHRDPAFDARTDVVLFGPPGSGEGAPAPAPPARVEALRSTADRLAARVEAPSPGVLVWSRTFFSAWEARVDGRRAATLVADGHLLGIPVPGGTHLVEVAWSPTPVLAGSLLCLAGLVAGLALRRSRA
jgi:hypothetical protein